MKKRARTAFTVTVGTAALAAAVYAASLLSTERLTGWWWIPYLALAATITWTARWALRWSRADLAHGRRVAARAGRLVEDFYWRTARRDEYNLALDISGRGLKAGDKHSVHADILERRAFVGIALCDDGVTRLKTLELVEDARDA